MNTSLTIFLLLFCVESSTFAQEAVFEKRPASCTNGSSSRIRNSSDGGYVFTGSFFSSAHHEKFIVKTDNEGIFQWQKDFVPEEQVSGNFCTSGDGGSVLISSKTGGRVFKLDSEGKEVWNKQLPVFCYTIAPTMDDGFILLGGIEEIYLVKIDSLGNTIWNRNLQTKPTLSIVKQTNDAGFILGGATKEGPENKKGYLIKTDSAGSIVWKHEYGNSGSMIFFVDELPGGDLIAATSFGINDFSVFHLSSSGNIIRASHFPEIKVWARCGFLTKDKSDLVIGGNDFNTGNFKLLILNLNGAHPLSIRTYESIDHESSSFISEVTADRDGFIVVCGFSKNEDNIYLPLLIKFHLF